MNDNTNTIRKGIKFGLTRKATTFAVIAVLFVSFFSANLITLPAMADSSANATASANANIGNTNVGSSVNASVNVNKGSNSNNNNAATNEKQAARQTLRQALQHDQMIYKLAVQTADLTYKQAVQQADLTHRQTVQDTNLAYNQAAQQARTTYNTALHNAHGNVALIGQAMATRDQAIATAETARINSVASDDVVRDKAVNDAWSVHETTVYNALATRDGEDGTAQANFYTTIDNAALATRAQTIGQTHVTADNSILQARQTRISAVENADVARDQAIGSAETAYISAEISARVTLDNSYTSSGKAWNTALQGYWNSVATLKQTEDNSVAKANSDHVTAVGNADALRDSQIDQAYATMYGSIAAAYSS